MCLEHASRRLKDLQSLGHYLSICIRRRSTFRFHLSRTVSMCLKRVSRRLKDLQVRRRAHRNPLRTASNSESSKPLAHIGVGVVCKFAHADALRFHFHLFFPHCPLQSEKKCWEMDFLLQRNGIIANALHESALALCVRMCACVGMHPNLFSEAATRTVNVMKNV